MPFLMIRNDITKVAADAIVNPANRNLLQGSGTSRAIYQAAGEQELTASCEAIGRCDLGRAVCTPAFGLPAKYIFHAVCPAWHGGFFGEAKQLAGVYHSALELAAEYHCESVAFPLLSSGNYGYPKEQAFRIAVDTITQYVMEHDLTVYLVLYDRDCTALLDAIGYGVEKMVNIQRHLPEDERAEKVIFVITTDGLENASKRFSYEKIRRMIEREKEQYGWEFLFLGANIDAVQEAARFGIGADRAVRFENDAQGVAVNYHVVSETVCRMREAPCCASIGAEWKEQIEADFQKRHQE